jgi:RNA polymerase sigma factor (sigma-70 family)
LEVLSGTSSFFNSVIVLNAYAAIGYITILNANVNLEFFNETMQPQEDKNALFNRLIQSCIRGKREAQYQLYNLLSGKMFAVCLRYSNDRESAEDILQEGFVKVFQNMEKFRGEGSFEGWVRRIFVNTAVEHFRKNTKMMPVVSLDAVSYGLEYEAPHHNLDLEDLMKFIQTLSPGYRTVFNLYVIEGYSHKEIGEMLKISEGTSKSQLARARYLLQRMIVDANQIAKPNVAAQ